MRWLLLLSLCLIGLLAAGPAAAHQQGKSYCTAQTAVGGIDVTVETAAPHLVPALGLASRHPSDAELLAAGDRLLQRLEDHVTARTPSGPCRVEPGEVRLGTLEGERSVLADLHFFCPAGSVTLRNTWRLDVDPSGESVCAIDGAAWVFRAGSEEREVGTPAQASEVFASFVGLGAVHVLGGIDHVLFVLALLVAAALPARRLGLRRGLMHMAAIVTGFTLGHSVTLIAAGLGLLRVEPRLTESIIAASIVVVGLENLRRSEPRHRVVTATLFGLVHGFGFASVLAETGLPKRATVGALFSFNVGIELAQLGIVGLAYPLFAWAARREHYRRRVLIPISLAVAALAALWFVKRAFALDFLPWLGG